MSVHDLNCLPDKKCPLRGCWALQRPIACLRQKIAAQPSGPTFRRAFHNSDGLLALGPLAAAAIGFAVLPPAPFRREPRPARAPLRSLLQNRYALRFVVAYGL